jgi:hypothetical protein
MKILELYSRFAEAARTNSSNLNCPSTRYEWRDKGLKEFEKRTLGRSSTAIKSVDELTDVLDDMNVLCYRNEGKAFVMDLCDHNLRYNNTVIKFKSITKNNKEYCEIIKENHHKPDGFLDRLSYFFKKLY